MIAKWRKITLQILEILTKMGTEERFSMPANLKGMEHGNRVSRPILKVKYWISELATELQERLDMDLQQNQRMAHLLTMHAGTNHGYKVNQAQKFPSKSCVLRYGKDKVALDACRLFERGLTDYLALNNVSPKRSSGSSTWAITSLFIGASNIWATPAGMNPITRFFTSPASSMPANDTEEKAGPSSPQSFSSIWSLDVPLSPHKSSDTDGEHDCEADLDLTDSASEVEFRERSENIQESDVVCTPTFGQIGHINTSTCTLQLPKADPGMMEDNISVNPERPSGQTTTEAQAFVLNCSPVDQEPAAQNGCAPACKKEKHEISFEINSKWQTGDVLELSNACENELMELGGGEGPSDVCRKEPPVAFRGSGTHSHTSRVLKLKDMWNCKDSSITGCRRETAPDNHFQGYKQEEIDETVLSELPPEIQEELCRSLGCKRPRMVGGKKATIGDFFKNSTSNRGH